MYVAIGTDLPLHISLKKVPLHTLLRTKHPGRINKYNQDRNGYNPAHQKAPCFKPA